MSAKAEAPLTNKDLESAPDDGNRDEQIEGDSTFGTSRLNPSTLPRRDFLCFCSISRRSTNPMVLDLCCRS